MYFWCGCDVWGKILKNYDVSIIVPIYNVEKFIEKCAITLMEQDYENIEYIFVNDCTPDNSMQVLSDTLAKYPNRKDDIKIINNAQNSGSSITRKNGLDIANGEYILFIDSDDWVELDMVSSMLKKAKETDADIICCDYFVNFKNKENYMINLNTNDAFQAIKDILSLKSYASMWNKLVKIDVYNKIQFPTFSNREDYFMNIQMFYYCKNFVYFNRAFLHYRKDNDNSIVTQNSEKSKEELIKSYFATANFLKSVNIFNKMEKYLNMGVLLGALNAYNGDIKSLRAKLPTEILCAKYITRNSNISIIKKIVYFMPFAKLGFVFRFIIFIRRYLK